MSISVVEIIKSAFSFLNDWIKYPLDKLSKKKEHDKALYKEIAGIIGTEMMRDFFITLGYNRYYFKQSHDIGTYFNFIDRVDKYFFDKKIQKSREDFDSELFKLMEFLSVHFFIPHMPREVDYYALYPDKEDTKEYYEMYKQREAEFASLYTSVEKKYEAYVKVVKKRLII